MNRLYSKISSYFTHASILIATTLSTSAFADGLPVVKVPGSSDTSDYIGTFKSIVWGVLSLAALIICAKLFFSAIEGVSTRFHEWQKGKATIADLVGITLAAVALLAFGVFLLTQLSSALGLDFSF